MDTLHRLQERRHLAQADRHIAAAKIYIARQRKIVSQTREGTPVFDMAEDALRAMEKTLGLFERHRQLIIKQLQDGQPHARSPANVIRPVGG